MASAPRIAHLSTVHHDWDNRIVNKECRALAEAGLDTHLVISAPEDRVTRGVHVHALQRRGRLARLFGSQRQAWGVLRGLRPDLLHVHDPELIPMALLWGTVRRRPVVYDAHEDLVKQIATKGYLHGRRAHLMRPMARVLLWMADWGCDAVVTATEPIADTFRTRLFGRERPVRVVRNLPWSSDFRVADVASNGPVAVYTGDISEARGFTRMVEAIRSVPGARLVLAGRALRQDIDPGEDEQVEYRGLVPPSELPDIIASGRVGLVLLQRLPNYENSLPTKVFEYMASGVPFLATDFPAWQELFGGYDAGVFVDSDDPDAVASALASLLADPERCAEMGRNGRRAVEEEFGFESEAVPLVELVGSLSAGRRSPRGA